MAAVPRRVCVTVVVTIVIGLVGLSQAVPTTDTNGYVNDAENLEEGSVTLNLLLLLLRKIDAEQTQIKQELSRLNLELEAMKKVNEDSGSHQEGEQSRLRALLEKQEETIKQSQEDIKQNKEKLSLIQIGGNITSVATALQLQKFSCYSPERPRDCYDLLQEGMNISGVYTIYPQKCGRIGEGVRVWCDMEGNDGGWTVFLNRMNQVEQVNFNRGWREYRIGFGNPENEYWLGNDVLNVITSYTTQTLRVDMIDWDGDTRYAEYNIFQVEDRDNQYRLHLGGYSGTSGDAFMNHNHMLFSTPDRDNDITSSHCANSHHAGFWFTSCYSVSPTNELLGKSTSSTGIRWTSWHSYTMKNITFKLKPSVCRE